jgi:SAM-dependent methyltransferase
VACGVGAVLVQAAHVVGPGSLAVGIDLAEPMAAVAASKLQRLDQAHGVVAVMDAERLGLWAGWFDVVCCASAIYLLSDRPRRRSPRSRPAVKPMGRCTGGPRWSMPSLRGDVTRLLCLSSAAGVWFHA